MSVIIHVLIFLDVLALILLFFREFCRVGEAVEVLGFCVEEKESGSGLKGVKNNKWAGAEYWVVKEWAGK